MVAAPRLGLAYDLLVLGLDLLAVGFDVVERGLQLRLGEIEPLTDLVKRPDVVQVV
jgi:hypothetical protein